jgi:Holliday junction resolvase
MSNPQYVKGRRKEYRIVNTAKAEGKISFRSAGSHSPVDVVIIDILAKKIHLVQCKPDSYPESAVLKLYAENKALPGHYQVYFDVI